MIEAKITLPGIFVSHQQFCTYVCKYPMGDKWLAIKDQKTGQNGGICLTLTAFWTLTFSRFVWLPVLDIFPSIIFYVNMCSSEHESKQHLEANNL